MIWLSSCLFGDRRQLHIADAAHNLDLKFSYLLLGKSIDHAGHCHEKIFNASWWCRCCSRWSIFTAIVFVFIGIRIVTGLTFTGGRWFSFDAEVFLQKNLFFEKFPVNPCLRIGFPFLQILLEFDSNSLNSRNQLRLGHMQLFADFSMGIWSRIVLRKIWMLSVPEIWMQLVQFDELAHLAVRPISAMTRHVEEERCYTVGRHNWTELKGQIISISDVQPTNLENGTFNPFGFVWHSLARNARVRTNSSLEVLIARRMNKPNKRNSKLCNGQFLYFCQKQIWYRNLVWTQRTSKQTNDSLLRMLCIITKAINITSFFRVQCSWSNRIAQLNLWGEIWNEINK